MLEVMFGDGDEYFFAKDLSKFIETDRNTASSLGLRVRRPGLRGTRVSLVAYAGVHDRGRLGVGFSAIPNVGTKF